jgi:hypothetical protein
MLLSQLPPDLENVEALLARREAAKKRKDMWRSVYQEAQRYACPTRETFTWQTEGQPKNRDLYDTTLQDMTTSAANTLVATLFPPWSRWAEYAPGALVDEAQLPEETAQAIQEMTETFFGFLNSSNFGSTIGEVAVDLMIGTGALQFDESDDDERPFRFTSIPLSALELEEGPDGTVETKFMPREPQAQHLMAMYPGMELFDLPDDVRTALVTNPTKPVKIIQCEVYHRPTKSYYGIVIDETAKEIIWRYNYGPSCPMIVARAGKVAGELYGRGRVLLALSDAKTLDKMQEFVLRHAALQVAPPLTGISDGVLNPYTARLAPNTILPVASNDSGNPSLRALDIGGNFQITDKMMSDLKESIRRKLLGPVRSEGAVESATEIATGDRDRLWSLGGEYARIQFELLLKILERGAYILQKRGMAPKFKVGGKLISVRYTSPFAKSQAQEDIQALQRVIATSQAVDPSNSALGMGIKIEDVPAWVARKEGLDKKLIRSADEKKQVGDTAKAAVETAMQSDQAQGGQPQQGQPTPQEA